MQDSKIHYSVAIPTYRRLDILKRCLDSINSHVERNSHDIMILDNDSDNLVRELVESYGRDDMRYLESPILGLSASRNLALSSAKYDWLVLLDDDALVREGFTGVLSNFLNSDSKVGCFGGEIHSYFDKKPFWLPHYFESMFFEKTDHNVTDDFKISGGAMAINRKQIGNTRFDENQGMRGKQLGYGAETMFVNKLFENGIQIGHCKEWKVDHLIRPEKTSFAWLNNSWKNRASTYNQMYNPSLFKSLGMFFRNLIGLFTILPIKALFTIFRDKEKAHLYSFRYFRNFIISSYILRNSLKGQLNNH